MPENLPTAVQLDFLTQAAHVAKLFGTAFEQAEALARKAQLMDELANLDTRNWSETEGVFRNFNPANLTAFLNAIPAMSTVAQANGSSLMKATFALSARAK